MRSYDAAASTSASRDFASSHELVLNQCALLGKQLGQVGDLKRDAVSALHDLSGLAHNIDLALRPVKEATEGLSRGLANIEKVRSRLLTRLAENLRDLSTPFSLHAFAERNDSLLHLRRPTVSSNNGGDLRAARGEQEAAALHRPGFAEVQHD